MTQALPATRSRLRVYHQSRLDPVSFAVAVGAIGLLLKRYPEPHG